MESISDLTVNRLSIYLRCLTQLQEIGVKTISSKRLAHLFQLSSAQIRKDLACFGAFGVRGVGYYVDELVDRITNIIGLSGSFKTAIFGAGHLGQALADYKSFNGEGFEVVALFDSSPRKIGRSTRGRIPILDVADFESVVREKGIRIAVMAVPAKVAQALADRIVSSGISAMLNFTPANLRVPEKVKLNHVDLKIQMENLAFFLTHPGFYTRSPGVQHSDRRTRKG